MQSNVLRQFTNDKLFGASPLEGWPITIHMWIEFYCSWRHSWRYYSSRKIYNLWWIKNISIDPSKNIKLYHLQITIDGFSVGKFCSYITEGCPDGYLQISEVSRTSFGGMWCGSMDNGPVIFYSETRTVILSIKLLRYKFFIILYTIICANLSMTTEQ